MNQRNVHCAPYTQVTTNLTTMTETETSQAAALSDHAMSGTPKTPKTPEPDYEESQVDFGLDPDHGHDRQHTDIHQELRYDRQDHHGDVDVDAADFDAATTATSETRDTRNAIAASELGSEFGGDTDAVDTDEPATSGLAVQVTGQDDCSSVSHSQLPKTSLSDILTQVPAYGDDSMNSMDTMDVDMNHGPGSSLEESMSVPNDQDRLVGIVDNVVKSNVPDAPNVTATTSTQVTQVTVATDAAITTVDVTTSSHTTTGEHPPPEANTPRRPGLSLRQFFRPLPVGVRSGACCREDCLTSNMHFNNDLSGRAAPDHVYAGFAVPEPWPKPTVKTLDDMIDWSKQYNKNLASVLPRGALCVLMHRLSKGSYSTAYSGIDAPGSVSRIRLISMYVFYL